MSDGEELAQADRPDPYKVTIIIEDPDGKRVSTLSGLLAEAVDIDVEYHPPQRAGWLLARDIVNPLPRAFRLTLFHLQADDDGHYLHQTNATYNTDGGEE